MSKLVMYAGYLALLEYWNLSGHGTLGFWLGSQL
jgi:hypothetical protein